MDTIAEQAAPPVLRVSSDSRRASRASAATSPSDPPMVAVASHVMPTSASAAYRHARRAARILDQEHERLFGVPDRADQ